LLPNHFFLADKTKANYLAAIKELHSGRAKQIAANFACLLRVTAL